MNKNKLGQETTWSLWRIKHGDYPSVSYAWVDETGIIRYQKDIAPIGIMPVVAFNMVGKEANSIEDLKKYSNHRMTDEQLKLGWLNL